MDAEENPTKNEEKKEKPKFVARTPTDVQRIKLQKLMNNPVKYIISIDLS